MFNCPEAAAKAFCKNMEKAPDTIHERCGKCGKTLRLITSMLEPRSGTTFHVFLCDCGEKSWSADGK
jgi:hypothetical protein